LTKNPFRAEWWRTFVGISKNQYQFVKRFGETPEDAFRNVQQAISKLIIDGKNEDIENLKLNPISNMVKGKILCTYFPERYLNVFSPEHLNYFIKQLNLDNVDLHKTNPIDKREILIKFKNQDSIMKNWSNDIFSHFLYTEYPRSPPKKEVNFNKTVDLLSEYRMPEFPLNQKLEIIDLKILEPKKIGKQNLTNESSKKPKQDYEQEARKLKKIGSRGEKLVYELEKQNLKDNGRSDLSDKVIQVSLESDSIGYDILSYDIAGTKKHIEVKTTTSKVGNTNFFLTINELKTAQEIKNYFIYVVYDILSENPKVWQIRNPFNPENENIIKIPTNYRVTINTSKD